MSQQLPLRPVKTIKSAVPAFYSLLKPGVDGATQYLAQLRNSTLRYGWAQKVVMDTLFCLATNTVLIHRALRQHDSEWTGVTAFRDSCSRSRSFTDTIVQLCVSMAMTVNRRRAATAAAQTAVAPAAASTTPLPRRNRLSFFNSPDGRGRRMRDRRRHAVSQLTNTSDAKPVRRRCVVCHRKQHWFCATCTGNDAVPVGLCRSKRGRMSCFEYFHSADVLQFQGADSYSPGDTEPDSE